MALKTNKPDVERLQRQLKHTGVEYGGDVDAADLATLDELLQASIAAVELKVRMPFNGRAIRELRDGNGTDSIEPWWKPITSVQLVEVNLPILGLNRTYTPDEIKIYGNGGRIRVFTYKLASEQATLHLDAQIWANIFPVLPQCVELRYTAGFPQYDADAGVTSLDGSTGPADGIVRLAGDQRDYRQTLWIPGLQLAAVCDAAACYLAQIARNEVGLVSSVSFDGYSEGLNPQAFGPGVDALIQRRDQLLTARATPILRATG